MTRNEALKKVNAIESSRFDEDIVSSLEALGLIKFDEEKKVPSSASIIALEINNFTSIPHCLSEKIIEALAKYNYKIVLRDQI